MLPNHKPAPAFQIVKDFEDAIAEYTGAPNVVAVNSCTMALRLCLGWQWEEEFVRNPKLVPNLTISIPKHTYVSVPMQILDAGFNLEFRDEDWRGYYQLKPLPIRDCARWFTGNMFRSIADDEDSFVCVSFHATKTLGLRRPIGAWEGMQVTDPEPWDIEQGGAILHNASPECDHWLRAARHDGRIEGQPISNETVKQIGFHCYLNPSSARLGLKLLKDLPRHNAPLPNDDFPDLSTFGVFER